VSESASKARALPLEKAAPALAMRLNWVQSRMARVSLGTGLAMAAIVLIVWLGVEMPLDWHFELPRWARAMFLLVGLGSVIGTAWRFGFRHWLQRPETDHVALAIERALPELRSRLIASVQLSRRAEDHALPLVRALVDDTSERTRQLEFGRVVPTDRLRRWSYGAVAACVMAAAFWWHGGTASWPLFQRAWLLNTPNPSNTRIMAFTGNRVIAKGDDLRLEAFVAGVIPLSGRLKAQTLPAKAAEFTLDADPANPARFLRGIQSVQESFRYRIELGDTQTDWAEIRVRPRPVIHDLTFEQHWPEYTGVPPQRRNPGDLKLLAGSKLIATIKPNARLRDAALHLLSADRKIQSSFSMQPLPAGANAIPEWRGVAQIPANGATGLTFLLADEEGVQSTAMAVYRVEIAPDQPPTLAVLWPQRREELVTSRATLLVAFEASDDFGIDRVKLHYAVNWIPDAPHQTLEMDLGGAFPKSLTRRFEWRLARLDPPLKEGEVVDYWFEAVDRNNVTGPGVATLAEHYQARIVTEDEKRADLATRLTETLQGLNELRQGQEDLARRLGEIIYEKRP
jgi:hypothetical protein